MRAAVIDVGSNSVLLLIGERTTTGWRTLLDTTRITRLGEGFSAEKRLQPPAIERTLQAIEAYGATCRALGVEQILVAATAVVREACNQEAFLNAVCDRLPQTAELRVLSEYEEARYSFLSVVRDAALFIGEDTDATPGSTGIPIHTIPAAPPTVPTVAVLDIGGGSVEVALGRADVEHWFSFPVGAGRLRETHMPGDPPDPREVLNAVRFLDESFAPLRHLPQPDRVVAIGGTGVNLAVLALGLTAFDPAKVHGVWFGDETPAALLERLLRLRDAERRALSGIEPDRAPLLHIGALILERALFALRREAVQISTRGLRYGLLWSL